MISRMVRMLGSAVIIAALASCGAEPARESGGPASRNHNTLRGNMKMADRICLVTGATSGIGKLTAAALAEQGATVIVVSRDERRCADTVDEIRAATGNPAVEYMVADLSDLGQVRRLASQVAARYPRLDVLVNNAGAYFLKRLETPDGYELTWALNYLSPFLLTQLLLPSLEASESARVINVSSNAHTQGVIDFDDLQSLNDFVGLEAYAQSKLALVMFTYELARRARDSNITVNALHPGLVATRFGRNNGWLRFHVRRLVKRNEISPEEGAQTSIYLATSPEVEGVTGKYYVKNRPKKSSESSYDLDLSARLWQVSEDMTEGAMPIDVDVVAVGEPSDSS